MVVVGFWSLGSKIEKRGGDSEFDSLEDRLRATPLTSSMLPSTFLAPLLPPKSTQQEATTMEVPIPSLLRVQTNPKTTLET